MPPERVVVDTNAFISRLLVPDSLPGRAVRKAVDTAQLLVSEATLTELADVLSRAKFDVYVSIEDRQGFFRRLARLAEVVPITYIVHACPEPKDDKFLGLAVNDNTDLIVTDDLLVLNPFRGIQIITPANYLEG
jgi:putative PIN family toxin of toxin-antitoxin system